MHRVCLVAGSGICCQAWLGSVGVSAEAGAHAAAAAAAVWAETPAAPAAVSVLPVVWSGESDAESAAPVVGSAAESAGAAAADVAAGLRAPVYEQEHRHQLL